MITIPLDDNGFNSFLCKDMFKRALDGASARSGGTSHCNNGMFLGHGISFSKMDKALGG
jgi:hypothetical protein